MTNQAQAIREFIEAGKKRTPGEWEAGVHPANHNINIVKPIFFGNRGGKLPECEGSHLYLKSEPDATFIAAASRLDLSDILDVVREMAEALESIIEPAEAYDNGKLRWEPANINLNDMDFAKKVLRRARPYLGGE